MNAWIETLNGGSATWFDLIVRASWQGGIALAAVWLISRFISRIPPAYKVWLWRLAFLKLVLALVWLTPVALPVLPPESQNVLIAEPVPPVASIAAETAFAELPAFQTIAQTPPLNWRAWLLIAWCAGLFCGATRLARHGLQARRLLAQAQPLRKSNLEELAKRLTKCFGLRRTPILMESSVISSPILLGILRPRVILPGNMSDSASQSRLELMLAHELAHCRRKDLLWLWLFALAEALFFFHPLVWLARREWTLATEAACDQTAIRFTRQTPGDYGEMLVDIVAATSRCASATPLVAVGIIENAHTLKRRLNLMITTRTRFASIGGIALITIATLGMVPWKLTAQDVGPEAVAKLKEENAKLRQELEAVRRDAEKMRADTERMRNPAVAERDNNSLIERRRAEQLKRDFAGDARKFEQQRLIEKMQAQLEQLRTQFSDENPLVRRRQAQIEKMRAESERLRERAVAEGENEAADQARRAAELENRARMFARQQQTMENMQAALKELRARFTDEHPEVRKMEAELEKLEASMAAVNSDPLEPSPKPEMPRDPANERASKRVTRHQEEQRALLQRELELVERQVEMTRKNVEAGVQSQAALLAAQRELLDVKLQLAKAANRQDEASAAIRQQIEIANKMLKENKRLVERRLAPVGSEISLEREVLRLTRKLHELEESGSTE